MEKAVNHGGFMAKKVIIIGGGVAGLSSAIYLQKNGYQTVVLEKNSTLGGACIGWERKGCYIDGCIHWLVGANPKSPTYKLWEEVGALSNDVEIFNQEDFCVLDFADGKKFTMWTDLERLEKDLIAFAPEDQKQIKKFCRLVKRFEKINAPTEKPTDLMNLWDFLKIGFTMAGDYYHYGKACKVSCQDYAKKFKNPYLRKWIAEHMSANYNLMSFLYMYAHVTSKDGGIPIGGSVGLVERIKEKAVSLGAEIRVLAEVEKIDIENGVAKGVTLKNGESLQADWIISTAPIEYTLKNLLNSKYSFKNFEFMFDDRKNYPIYTFTTAVFKVQGDGAKYPLSHRVFLFDAIKLEKEHGSVTFRNYSYDKTLKTPDGHFVVQATLSGDDEMYFWWKDIKEKGDYRAKKQEIAQKLLEIYLAKYPELKGKVEIIDTITPMTYERYLNGRNGSFQAFVHTSTGKAINKKGVIKGLKNFHLAGQWLLAGGGLPPAVITARFTAQRICKADKIKFKSK